MGQQIWGGADWEQGVGKITSNGMGSKGWYSWLPGTSHTSQWVFANKTEKFILNYMQNMVVKKTDSIGIKRVGQNQILSYGPTKTSSGLQSANKEIGWLRNKQICVPDAETGGYKSPQKKLLGGVVDGLRDSSNYANGSNNGNKKQIITPQKPIHLSPSSPNPTSGNCHHCFSNTSINGGTVVSIAYWGGELLVGQKKFFLLKKSYWRHFQKANWFWVIWTWWSGGAGFTRREKKQVMLSCHQKKILIRVK